MCLRETVSTLTAPKKKTESRTCLFFRKEFYLSNECVREFPLKIYSMCVPSYAQICMD